MRESLKGGRPNKRRMRRSKREDHLVNLTFGKTKQSRIMDDGGVKTL
jgi:hypothetical protein